MKERDEETGYGYFGARYMDHELMTMWLSVDPLADKYPNISPYAYCAWNPVKLVDPEGREAIDEDDWYKDKNGYVHWDANVHSQKDLKNGEEYLGKTVMMTAEGCDEVTYGDQYGHTWESVSLREVSITEKASNPLVDRIHRSSGDFWGTVVDIGLEVCSQTFNYCGLGMQTVGFYCLVTPGGKIIGAELYATGNVMSEIGLGFDAINNIRKEDWIGLSLDVISITVPRSISKQINKSIFSGFLSACPNDVDLLNSYISTRVGYATEAVNKGRRK